MRSLQLNVNYPFLIHVSILQLIQRRSESAEKEDFYRLYDEYEAGFGNLTDEHWIGA